VAPIFEWHTFPELYRRNQSVLMTAFFNTKRSYTHLKIRQKSAGFTLIELLVVIAIIGLLSSIVLASLQSARAKAADAQRKSSMKELQKAIELYYDKYGAYPNTNQCWAGLSANGSLCMGARTLSGPTGWIPNLAPEFLSILPDDASKGRSEWNGYLYLSNGYQYKLLLHDTPNSYPNPGQTFYDPIRPTWAWMICSGYTGESPSGDQLCDF